MEVLIILAISLLIVYVLIRSGSRNDTSSSPNPKKPQPGKKSDIEELREYYGLSKRKMKSILGMLGLSGVSKLTQEQSDRVIDAILRDSPSSSQHTPPVKPSFSQSPQKTVERKPIEDKGHKILQVPITTLRDDGISRSVIPSEGSKVFSDKGKEYVLGGLIGSGGEGSVYSINSPDYVAKIYDAEHCTARRRDKLSMMLKAKLKKKGICLPCEILYTANKEFTGYIMPKAKGSSLLALFNPHIFNSKFPGWKKADMIKLSVTILRKISYLHSQDVIIGDINPRNILVVSPEEVYFVDTDSYQYRGFPCPVGTPEYTAPEIQGRDFGSFLRTQGNENFTVAILLFRLMMQGQSPYAYQGGGSPVENIKAGKFPYAAYGRKVPDVYNLQPLAFRYVWSHLMMRLKEAFWDTFHKEGSHNTEATRYSVNVWLELMRAYQSSLPKMLEDDQMSGELFPTRLKKSKYVNYRVCSRCGEEKAEDMFYDATTCRECHEEIRNEVYTTLTCVNCGRTFQFTRGEFEHYQKMGFTLPKRCPDCRK